MKFNQPNSARQSAAHQSAVHPVAPAASVPISVYRELAAELQATRAMVDALNGKTQQLDRENQMLRLEMQRVLHSVLALQPWVNGLPEPVPASNQPTWEETAAASAIAANLRASQEPRPAVQEPNEPPAKPGPQKSGRLGGLWLILTVLGIIIGAFGAGFLLMRPLLPTVSPESSPAASPEAASPAATQPLNPLNPPTHSPIAPASPASHP